jgi:hypothetical protein
LAEPAHRELGLSEGPAQAGKKKSVMRIEAATTTLKAHCCSVDILRVYGSSMVTGDVLDPKGLAMEERQEVAVRKSSWSCREVIPSREV